MRRHRCLLLLLTTIIVMSGCAALKADPTICDAIKDGTFAVGSFGCMRIQEPVARDVCTKAALAGALVARSACLAKLAEGATPSAETGDPPTPEDARLAQDAEAIIQEWKTLELPQDHTPHH